VLLKDLLGRSQFDLGIYLVGETEIRRLNERFLQHKGSTDVITFDYTDPAQPEFLRGEIFICADEAVAQSRRFRTTWQAELVRYLVHGVLHLSGYDDRRNTERRKMKREEDRLLQELSSSLFTKELRARRLWQGTPRSPAEPGSPGSA